MSRPSDPARRAAFREDTSAATLAALLLAVLVPAALAAMALGWRPLETPPARAALAWWTGVRGGDPAAAGPAVSTTPTSWALADGYFYTVTAGAAAGPGPRGYAVTDADGVPFWSEFQRLGGVRRSRHTGGAPSTRRWKGAFILQDKNDARAPGAPRTAPAGGRSGLARMIALMSNV